MGPSDHCLVKNKRLIRMLTRIRKRPKRKILAMNKKRQIRLVRMRAQMIMRAKQMTIVARLAAKSILIQKQRLGRLKLMLVK